MEKKKKAPIIIAVGAILIGVFVILATYAYWQLTKKQTGINNLRTACLDFTMEGGTSISLASAMPTSDDEGRAGTGYTFTVTNNCPYDVNYVIGIEALEDTENPNYIDNQYLRIAIDDEIAKNLSDLTIIDNIIDESDTEKVLETRQLVTSTLKANGSNEHVVKMWLSIDTPLTEQNKTFKSRIVVTGGQGIENTSLKATADKCFTIDENGQITAYNIADSDCSENVVIPAKVNDIKVKTIDTDAFRGTALKTMYYNSYDDNWVQISSIEKELANVSMVGTITDISLVNEMVPEYFVTNTTDSEILAIVEKEVANMEADLGKDIPVYTFENEPDLQENQFKQYIRFYKNENGISSDFLGAEYKKQKTGITIAGLNLSKAIYLDTIEDSAFSNVPASVTDLSTYSNYDISLTSLAFGENGKDIKLGHNAFARIIADDLTTYASYYTGLSADNSDFLTPFGGSTIQNLVIKPTSLIKNLDGEINADTSKTKAPIYVGMTVNNMTISEGITSWLKPTFTDCSLGTVNLPNSMDFSLGSHFSLVKSIDKLVLPSRLTVVPESAFSNIKATSVVLPDTLERIEKNAFSDSTITSINLPNSLTYIGVNAFMYSSLSSITLPNSLTHIDDYAFYVTHLNSVTIPSSVMTIGNYAFYSNSSNPLNTITFKGRTDTSGITLSSDYINQSLTTEVFEP